jgi:hypothetical protein
VAGLARRVNDSPQLQTAFLRHVETKQQQPNAPPVTKAALDRRVPTRWNSDFTCLQAHVTLRFYVASFVKDPDYGLEEYALTAEQWKLARHLTDVLVVCLHSCEVSCRQQP